MPVVIPVTWEAVIERIEVQSQPRQKASEIPSHKLGMVVYTCHPSYARGLNRRISIQAGLSKKARPLLKKELKPKGLGHCLSGRSTCLGSMRSQFEPQ
jgi:hypothetical protein